MTTRDVNEPGRANDKFKLYSNAVFQSVADATEGRSRDAYSKNSTLLLANPLIRFCFQSFREPLLHCIRFIA